MTPYILAQLIQGELFSLWTVIHVQLFSLWTVIHVQLFLARGRAITQ